MNGPSPELRARILAAAAATPSPTRREVRRASLAALLAGAVVTALAHVLMGGLRLGERQLNEAILQASAMSAAALLVSGWGLLRAKHAAKPWEWTLALIAPFLAAGALAFALPLRAYPGPVADLACALSTFGLSLPSGAALLFAVRRREPARPFLLAAVMAGAAAAFAAVPVALHCPHTHPLHLVVGHALALLLPIAVGTSAGARLVKP